MACSVPPTTSFAEGKLQVAAGVRGNANFAARDAFQGCYDAKLLRACDPSDPHCTTLLADGIATCQSLPRRGEDALLQCSKRAVVGHVHPATCTKFSAAGVQPAFNTLGGRGSGCAAQKVGPTPSMAQACVEDIPIQTAAGVTLGANAPMRMRRTPLFFDATAATADTDLAENFYAMHKRWGGAADAKCCEAVGTAGGSCAAPDGKTTFCAGNQEGNAAVCPAGDSSGWFNGGVRKENVYFANRKAGPKGEEQQVLCLRFQGDEAVVAPSVAVAQSSDPQVQATLGLPALGRAVKLKDSDIGAKYPSVIPSDGSVQCETCAVYPVDAPNANRVGSILATSDNYGGGLYEVYARVPPGNKGELGGLGYVFAMWSFHYSELYPTFARAADGRNVRSPKDGDGKEGAWHQDPMGQLMFGNTPDQATVDTPQLEYVGDNRFSCGLWSHSCDSTSRQCTTTIDGKPRKTCQLNDGPFTVWNHEIDIEIPSNACRLPRVDTGGPGKPCGWTSDTINFNTWLGDDQDYRDSAPYRNVGVRRMDASSFIARSQNDFHWYGYVWCTGNDAAGIKPYIDFYVDRQFVQRVSDAFIPSRASKLNLGPWFGWWGGTPAFGAKEVWIKYVNVVPFAAANDPFAGGDKMTTEQLNAAYQAAVAKQADGNAATPPRADAISHCDVEASANDVNANQMYDQCGTSKLRNVCDFAQFLVDGKSTGVPAGCIPHGKVMAAAEPQGKCGGTVPTIGQKVTAVPLSADGSSGGISTSAWMGTTINRPKFFDSRVDPDPDMASNIRPTTAFRADQAAFDMGADGPGAQLCGKTSWCSSDPKPAAALASTQRQQQRRRTWSVGVWVVVILLALVCVVGLGLLSKHARTRTQKHTRVRARI